MADLPFETAPIVTTINPLTDYIGGQVDGTPDKFNRMNARTIARSAGLRRVYLTDYATFAAAISDIGSTSCEFVVNVSTNCLATVSIPKTCTVMFENGSIITVAAGATLTIGRIAPPRDDRQIISLANSTAHVRFGKGAARKLCITWITGPGSTSSGSPTDLTQALNEHLASCLANLAGHIFVARGYWTSSSTHAWPSRTMISGEGKYNTTITHTINNAGLLKQGAATFHTDIKDIALIGICGKISETTFTFAATDVNTTTNEITKTSHGLTTGMEARITQAVVVAAPLVDTLRYYAISTGASTFKLATTKANALAATAIDLTTVGTVGAKAARGTGLGGGSVGIALFDDTTINTTTNVITSSAPHTFATGDEVVVGQTATLAAPLESGVAYYVIRTGANTFKLAYTPELALAGTPIDISTTGTAGTNTLIGIEWTSSTGILLEGAAADGASGYLNVRNTVIAGFHRNLAINATDRIWQFANIFGDKGSSSLAGDQGFYVNTPNYNLHWHGYMQSNWVPAASGGRTAYGQWAGKFDTHAPMEFVGELAGSVQSGTNFGRCQVETQIVPNGDAITVAGDVILKVTARKLRHPVTGADNYTAEVYCALTTADDTGAKIAAKYRTALARDASINQLFHVVHDYYEFLANGQRDVNLVFIDPDDEDLTANFEIDASGVTGATSAATSTRITPLPLMLPNGFEFTGAGSTVTFGRAQDEAIDTLLLANAQSVENIFAFDKFGIQSRIKANKKCTIKTRDCTVYPKMIRDGGHPVGSTVYGSPRYVSDDTVQLDPYMDLGMAIPVRPTIPRTHNFSQIGDGTLPQSGMIAHAILHHEGKVFTNYAIVGQKTTIGDNEIPGLSDLAAINGMCDDANTDLQWSFFFGRPSSLGRPGFGIKGRREDLGYFHTKSTQEDYPGWRHDGQYWAQAFIADQDTVALGSTDATDFNPGVLNIGTLRLTLTANSILRSMVSAKVGAGTLSRDGYEGTWINASAFTLTVKNEDGAGTAGFRFLTPGAVDFVIPARGQFHLIYDLTSNRWSIG